MATYTPEQKKKTPFVDVIKVMVMFLLSCVVRRVQYYTKASRYPCDPYYKVTILYALYFVPFFYWRQEDFDDDGSNAG